MRRSVRKTPEEAVRQALVRHLVGNLGVPRACVRTELALTPWDRNVRDRVDIAVFSASDGVAVPILLVECKAPEVALDSTVAAQVRRYLRLLPARWVAISNGSQIQSWVATDGAWEARPLPEWEAMKG